MRQWHSTFSDRLGPGLRPVARATLRVVTVPADVPDLPRRLPDGSILANVSTMDDQMRLVDGVATISPDDPSFARLDEWLTSIGR